MVRKIKWLRATEKSMLKWALISHGLLKDKGTKNCALCKLCDILASRNDNPCNFCPITMVDGRFSGCRNVQYMSWINHNRVIHGTFLPGGKYGCKTCTEYALHELLFLHGILNFYHIE